MYRYTMIWVAVQARYRIGKSHQNRKLCKNLLFFDFLKIVAVLTVPFAGPH